MEYQQAFRFDSLAALNAAPHGWDSQITPLRQEIHGATLTMAQSANILINTVELGDPTLQRGSTPKNMRTFSLMRRQSHGHAFRGYAIDLNTLIIIPRDRELYAVSAGSIELVNVSISEDILYRVAERLEISRHTLDTLPEAVSFGDRERTALLRLIETLAEFVVKYGDHRIAAQLSQGLEEELIAALLTSLTDLSRYGCVVPVNKRYRATRTAINYIRNHPRQPIRADELARQAGASSRTLEKGFAELLGMSPQQFIKTQRLRGCRQNLQDTRPISSSLVSDIASSWGFWHMGQFAADYRNLFGELPSQTARP